MKPALVKEVIKGIFGKPVTIQYPKEQTPIEPDFRGRHYADLKKCVGCSLCAIECPANAITMVKIPEEYIVPRTNAKRLYPVINYFRCVFCYRCVAVCPTSAYLATNEYRLASSNPIDSSQLSLSTTAKAGDV